MCVSLSLSCDTNDTEENSSLCICAPLQYCCCCCCCYASKFLIKIGAPGGALGVYYPSLFLIGCLFFSSIFSPLPFPVSFDNWTTMLWSAMDCVRLCGTPGGSVSPSTLLSIQLKQQQQLQQQILLQRYQVQQQQLAQHYACCYYACCYYDYCCCYSVYVIGISGTEEESRRGGPSRTWKARKGALIGSQE